MTPAPSATLVEAAVDSVAQARRAVEDGAQRLELCAALAVGGLTPDIALVTAVRTAVAVPVHVLVRPRPGGFVYDAAEVHVMCASIARVREEGADAVVIGALRPDGRVDRVAVEAMVTAAASCPVVAHRAVDAARDLEEAVAAMAAAGATRVLTSGGAATAEQGIERLGQLVRRFGGRETIGPEARRVTILAGGGVRGRHVRRLVTETGVREVHVGFPEGAEIDRVRAVVAALA